MARERFLAWLEAVAEALGDRVPDVMFVGGCVGAIYELPPGFPVRPTDDVDCVINVTRVENYEFSEQLRKRGFREAADENVICRWKLTMANQTSENETISVDIMPMDGSIFGFRNAWYEEAFQKAQSYQLPSGKTIRIIAPLYFVATKIEAFHDRGTLGPEDTDLEDIVATLFNEEVRTEITHARTKVGQYIHGELLSLRDDLIEFVPELVPGDLDSQQRGAELVVWLRKLTSRELH